MESLMEPVDRTDPKRVRNALRDVLAVAGIGIAVIAGGWMLVGDDPLRRQAVAWIGNVAMLVTVWIGLRRRGQSWEHLGLVRPIGGPRAVGRIVLQSIAVFVAALVGFLLGSMVILNLTSIEVNATATTYGYLQGNLPMLLVALVGVYVVSSFGEEVIYRGFLMTRIAEAGGTTAGAWRVSVVLSAVVFGLIHFTWGPMGVVQTMFMGLALAIAFLLVKRNLWVLVLAHAYMDTILLVQMYLGSPGAAGN
jgi:membrane protease YdiL (CAAX protease family)